MFNFFQKKVTRRKGQKTIVGILIFLLFFSSFGGLLYPVKRVEAQWVTLPLDSIASFGSWIGDIYKNLNTVYKDALSVAMVYFRKELEEYMVDEIIKWIGGGGDPKFVTDWEGFLTDTVDTAGAKMLEDVGGRDFVSGLCQPNWAVRIRIGLQKPPLFRTRARCTLSEIGANFDNFMDDFSNGGWQTWIRVSESQNNPYGTYMTIINEKMQREADAREAAEKDAEVGSGFLSDKRCRQIRYRSGDRAIGLWKKEEVPEAAECIKWEVQTPGTILVEGANKSSFGALEWVRNNESWQSYVVAITDAVVSRLVNEGLLAIQGVGSGDGSSGSPQPIVIGDYIDIVPPEVEAKPYDPWRIQIVANEPVDIFYSTDGNEPKIEANEIGLINLYRSPIKVLNPVVLKWFGIDKFSNKEDTRTWNTALEAPVGPPFEILGLETPVSVAGAVGSFSVALLSNEPSTIYYTLDGSQPTESSLRYVKKINMSFTNPADFSSLQAPNILRWFAVDLDGNRESDAKILTNITPPFPNPELPVIWDLTKPVANISASSSIAYADRISLDPSSSTDNDRTPQIIMYEWDFDNDQVYDWWIVDYNRDGIFDEEVCRDDINCANGASLDVDGMGMGIGGGFIGLVGTSTSPGSIEVRYARGAATIGLRVTDDEGLSDETSAILNIQ